MFIRKSRSLRHAFTIYFLWIIATGAMFSGGNKVSAQEQKTAPSSRKAIAYYSDAAGYQNKGAYKLAIEEWQKLLDEFADDPLASKAWHYMGICYTQLDPADYAAAATAFDKALEDKTLEVREEALINLSWCLFSQARSSEPNSLEQRQGLERARERLKEFLKSYSDSSYADQALFYMGEIAYSFGDTNNSIAYYKKFIETDALKKSNLRPGALYALAVAYEESQQDALAAQHFRTFLNEYADHRLTSEVNVRLADLLLKQGEASEAAKLLSGLIENKKDSMADYALLRLGYALSSQGEIEQAADYYARLLADFPNSKHVGTAALSLGQALFQRGQFDQAVQRFAQVLHSQDSQAAEAAHWMAITLLRQNKAEEAVEQVGKALRWAQDSPNYVSLQMDYADALYAIPSKLEQAREAYEKIVEKHANHPLAPRAAYNAAFASLQAGNVSQARKWSELFLNRYPQDPLRNDVTAVVAEALLQQGEHAAAAKSYTKLREVDRENPAFNQWTLRLAMAHYLDGDYPAAVSLLEREIGQLQADNQKAEALFILGASQLYQENMEEAIAQLKASHQTSDRWPAADEVLLLLSEAHARNKDNQSARTTLELLLKKFPNTRLKPQVEYKLAQLSAAFNEYNDAIRRYETLVRSPEAANYHNFATYGIVWCLMQQDKYAEALEKLGPLLEQRLGDSITDEAKLAQGICLRKTGQRDQAIEALEAFLAKRPIGTSLANGLYEVGLAYIQQGKLDKATASFQRIVEEVPEYLALDKVLYELAWNLQESSDKERATEYFEQLAQRFPASEFGAEATYMVAQSQYEAELYEKAATTYASVLDLTRDPELREKSQYKLGWSWFQQQQHVKAAQHFLHQSEDFPGGQLVVDALFMHAECAFRQERYEDALQGYQKARTAIESGHVNTAAEQIKSLVYLHGAQCYRELSRWEECEQWLTIITRDYPQSPHLWTAVYELGYCKQRQDDAPAALEYYNQVVKENRNELGARARFMMGEVYFSQRDFSRAIEEFTRVAYGFGGEKAPEDIKNWQAKSAFEAARCYEVLAPDLRGDSRVKAVEGAKKFYEDIVRDHAQHELAKQASTRLGELRNLR